MTENQWYQKSTPAMHL